MVHFAKLAHYIMDRKKLQGQLERSEIMIVYLYDLKAKNKKSYNRLKRSFYYHFNKIKLSDFSYKTKSVLFMADKYEKMLDNFFQGFKGNIEVYKIRTEDVEQIC